MAKGKKTGGRQKGVKNRSTLQREALISRAMAGIEGGVEPLEVMLSAMRKAWDDGDVDVAVAIAEKAAPYRHPKLANVQHSGDADNPVGMVIMTGVPEANADTDDDRPTSH